MTDVASIFAAECRGQLERLESALLQLEAAPREKTFVDAAFRAVHTIKGNASVLSYAELEWFAHVVESVLERVRSGTVLARADLITLLLACKDHLHFLLGLASIGEAASPDFADLDRARLIGQLAPYLEQGTIAQALAASPTATPTPVCAGTWHLSVRFDANVLRQGADPHYFLRHLESIAQRVTVRALTDALPRSADYDPESCYLHFEVELDTSADKHAIEDVFAFARESVHLRMRPPQQHIARYLERIAALPADDLRIGEVLVRVGALTADELATALRLQRTADNGNERTIGSILVDQEFVPPQLVAAVIARQQRLNDQIASASHYVKVPLDKLDQLIALVAGLNQSLSESALLSRPAQRAAAQLSHEALALARGVRQIRAGDAFGHFYRWVRDSSVKLGKQADFHLDSADIALDHTLADRLAEPLVHLIRNAVDHGIEAPEERLALGKSGSGTIGLAIRHEKRHLMVRVTDDGRGIDTCKLAENARERGWLNTSHTPSAQDLMALLFHPGFTTSEQVSAYSGRGVGLDVVKQSVEAAGGSIEVASAPGEGTSFCILLPLMSESGPYRQPLSARSAA